MGREIEVKLRLDDPAALRARLRTAGGKAQATVLEVNRIFDAADGALRRRGCALRVREATPAVGEAPATPGARATLTYKGPKQGGEFKSREELETAVDDPVAVVAMLERLGFVEKIVYEKRREAWDVGACEIVIDEMPGLGWFAEIEGPSEEAVRACRTRLGLDGASVVTESYVELAARHGTARDGGVHLRFELRS
jgi:adenylate cyclase class 2